MRRDARRRRADARRLARAGSSMARQGRLFRRQVARGHVRRPWLAGIESAFRHRSGASGASRDVVHRSTLMLRSVATATRLEAWPGSREVKPSLSPSFETAAARPPQDEVQACGPGLAMLRVAWPR